MSEQRIRQIAREEVSAYDFGRRISDMLTDSHYRLKQDIVQHCDLKIENYVEKKLDSQRRDIFQTIRDIARNDPIVMRNIEQISEDFKTQFSKHCSDETIKSKTAISEHLRAEVNYIGTIPPYEHIANQIKKDTRAEIQTVKTQSNIIIGGLAVVNVALLAYIARR
jgi:uncharacterized protein (UPF0147 family)